MADQPARLEAATVRAEVGSNIVYRFANDAASAADIPTLSGEIPNLSKIILTIQQEGADKISFSTRIYQTTAAGIAATADQEIFLVRADDPDEIYAVWQNVAGTAVDTGKRSLSAAAVIAATQAASDAATAAQESADDATARVARFLAPSSVEPIQRDNGQPLEVGDQWPNSSNGLIYNWNGTSWAPLNESVQELRGDLTSPSGAAVSGWKRESVSRRIDNVALALSEASIHLYEFMHLVTDRPSDTDKTTWDWSPSIQALWDASGATGLEGVLPRGIFKYKKQLKPVSGMQIKGRNGTEFRWAGLDTYGIFSNYSMDDVECEKINFTTETGGQIWYSSASGSAISDIKLKKCRFNFSGATQEGFLLNGARFDDVDGFEAVKCKFSGGWRDHAYNSGSPGGSGGNNTARDLEVRGKNVTVRRCTHTNTWSAHYFGNVSNLRTSENHFEDTADSAIFDRCTSGISRKKRIIGNTFKNIGKSPIKTLDSNNYDTLNKGYDSIVDDNDIENWGLYIQSGAILAGTGFRTSYDKVPDRDYMCKGLTISNNRFRGTGDILYQIYNVLDVKHKSNTADVAADVNFGSYCDGLTVEGSNVIRTTKRISIFSSERVMVSGGDFESPGAFLFSGSASQPFTGSIRFLGNRVSNTAGTPPERFFGVGVTGGNFDVTFIGSNNTFETKLPFSDSAESTSYNIASFAGGAGSAWVLTDSLVKFSDGVKSVVQMLGDISSPVYYSGSKGAAKILTPGVIRFAKSSARNDFGSISYNA